MMKAKEALIQTNNDLEKALEWVREDEAKAGIKKAEKLKDRQALEGLVGVVVGNVGEHGNRGAIVEVKKNLFLSLRNKDIIRDHGPGDLQLDNRNKNMTRSWTGKQHITIYMADRKGCSTG